MAKATIIIDVDSDQERESAKKWFSQNKNHLEYKSGNEGCGCCADIYYIKADKKTIATIPENILG